MECRPFLSLLYVSCQWRVSDIDIFARTAKGERQQRSETCLSRMIVTSSLSLSAELAVSESKAREW